MRGITSGFLSGIIVAAVLMIPAPPTRAEVGISITEEIVVTARKRQETAHDVPASVSALSGDALDDLVIDGMQDALRQIPGVLLISAGPDYLSDISIRGQGGGRVGFSETATGIYRNGIYIAGGGFGGRSFNRLDLFDVERFEVFRGPQGALYGRNAVGGAANIVSRKPSDIQEGRIRLGYSDPQRTRFEGVVNMPVSDSFALRLGGFYDNRNDGFIDIVDGDDGIDEQQFIGARIGARAKLGETVDVTLTYEYYSSEAPGFAPLGFRATTFNGMPLDPDRFERVMSDIGGVEVKEHILFLDATGEMPVGNWHLKGNYRNRDGDRRGEDLDHFIGFQGISFGPNEVVLFANQSEDFEKFGLEFFVTSADDASITWIAGVEYQTFEDDVLTTNQGNAVIPPLRRILRRDSFLEELNSWSVFGGMEFPLSERLKLGLEARVQRDNKDFSFDRTPFDATSLVTPFTLNDDQTWTEFTGTATLKFDLTDAQMLYGRIASGYRPGGFNVGIPADIPDAQDAVPYDPESALSYEIGLKSVHLDGRLRAGLAIWYMQTDDVQIVTQASPTINTFILQNGGDSESWGAEFELSGAMALGPGNLFGRLGLAHNDGEFQNGTVVLLSGVPTDISGNRLNRTRNLTANLALTYSQSLNNGLTAFATASVVTEQGGFENSSNTRQLDNYKLIDLRLGLEGDQWRASLYSQNLTDEIYRLQTISSNQFFNSLRVFGVDFTWNWGD